MGGEGPCGSHSTLPWLAKSLALSTMAPLLLEWGGLLSSFLVIPFPYVSKRGILLAAWLLSTKSADLITQGFKVTPTLLQRYLAPC